MEVAKVHSIETMGLVDGPGIRTVVFLQGCRLRCLYCHNPDTWEIGNGKEISSMELLNKVKRYRPYFESSEGGVTLSGGEPLLQPKFVEEFFKLCKAEGIHTCLDTAGFGLSRYDEILKYTDLVLLDIKHIDENIHKKLTGLSRKGFYMFLEALKKSDAKIWIRHVVLEGYTDDKYHLKKLIDFIKTISNVEKIELLPYHTHGINKYKELNLDYKLKGLEDFDKNKFMLIKEFFRENLKDTNIELH